MFFQVKYIFVFYFFLPFFSFAQNLVPNPSFEQYDTCPNYYSQIYHAIPWFHPTAGTSDYFNVCIDTSAIYGNYLGVPQNFIGNQNTKTGTAYAGEFLTYEYLDYKEYIEVKLTTPLQIGTKYFVSFYVSLSDSSFYATDNIGACFSVDTLKGDTLLTNTPHIVNPLGNFIANKSLWTAVYGSFIADSAYQYVTIGNFKNDANTDTVYVGAGGSALTGGWKYFSYYYVEDVCVSSDSLTCQTGVGINNISSQNDISLYPSITNGNFFIDINDNNFTVAKVTVYDQLGRSLLEKKINNGNNKINIDFLAKGIYLVSICVDNRFITKKIILTKN